MSQSSSSLNPPQLEAVTTLQGPLLVLAGAGTGKTRVITFRIARLIRSGIDSHRILAVTFTNKAANEMRQRVAQLLGRQTKDQPEISTFHSLCVRILRRHIDRLGYPKKFGICDRSDQESIIRGVLREIRVSGDTLRTGDVLQHIGSWKVRSVLPEAAAANAESDKEHLAAIAYRRYQKTLKAKGLVDFDDLLMCTEDLFANHPDVRREEAARFDHILIDEYQDTNASQYHIVKTMASGHRNLCVVGDDDQSIYGWRGAEVRHILDFQRDWPEAKSVRLEDNYRSTAAIIEFANRLIVFNRLRHDKQLRAARPNGDRPRIEQYPTESAEAEETIADLRRWLNHPGLEPQDFAILFRTNEQPRAFEFELRRHKLPYILVGGMSFYDRKEIRDILSYLRVIASPEDEVSLLRIINTPARGIGQKTVSSLLEQAIAGGSSLWNLLNDDATLQGLADGTRKSIVSFTELIKDFGNRFDQPPLADHVRQLINVIGYRDELTRNYRDPQEQQSRWDSIEELVNALAVYDRKTDTRGSMLSFLDEVMLNGRELNSDNDKLSGRNAIALMTLHSAKGLEFPHVYMVGMEEGILPHHRSIKADGDAIDEERRLCYVGFTRAQERLTLSLALTRLKWGKPRETDPSRFLFEATGQADNPHAVPGNRPGGKRYAVRKKSR